MHGPGRDSNEYADAVSRLAEEGCNIGGTLALSLHYLGMQMWTKWYSEELVKQTVLLLDDILSTWTYLQLYQQQCTVHANI